MAFVNSEEPMTYEQMESNSVFIWIVFLKIVRDYFLDHKIIQRVCTL
jgi:hypothetical protein